jgi:hypothetical protein
MEEILIIIVSVCASILFLSLTVFTIILAIKAIKDEL